MTTQPIKLLVINTNINLRMHRIQIQEIIEYVEKLWIENLGELYKHIVKSYRTMLETQWIYNLNI